MQTNVGIWNYASVPSRSRPLEISITLSPAQVDEVVRAASARDPDPAYPDAVTLVNGHGGADAVRLEVGELPEHGSVDPRLSRSLLRGLSLLRCFTPQRPERGIVEMSEELQMSPSTAHRYAQTLIEIGLLERDPDSRKYRLGGRHEISDSDGG